MNLLNKLRGGPKKVVRRKGSHVPKLAELTRKLTGRPHEFAFDGPSGGTPVITLRDRPGVGVVEAFMAKGTVFPRHEHEVTEFLIIFAGVVEVAARGTTTTIRAGEQITIDPRTPHVVTAIEDTSLIGVTVPMDQGYVHAG